MSIVRKLTDPSLLGYNDKCVSWSQELRIAHFNVLRAGKIIRASKKTGPCFEVLASFRTIILKKIFMGTQFNIILDGFIIFDVFLLEGTVLCTSKIRCKYYECIFTFSEHIFHASDRK